MKEKIIMPSLKINKILKIVGSDGTKRAVKALFSLWSLKKRKFGFMEKVERKRFYSEIDKQLSP